jgi:hypothetical protein
MLHEFSKLTSLEFQRPCSNSRILLKSSPETTKPDYLVGTFLNLYTALYIHPLGKSDTFITSVVIVYIADAIGVVHDIRKVVTGMPGRKSNVTFTMKDLR